ncbi:hypothetical protein ACLESD_47315 [Pyxidicoccus sp. 3LFB2]
MEAFVPEGGDTARRVLESMGFRAREVSSLHDEARPSGHLCLRLDLPAHPKGHFLMAPQQAPVARTHLRVLPAALSA